MILWKNSWAYQTSTTKAIHMGLFTLARQSTTRCFHLALEEASFGGEGGGVGRDYSPSKTN